MVHVPRPSTLILSAALASAPASAWAERVQVSAYADADHDGQRGSGEAGVPGVVVASGSAWGVTDAHGEAVLDAGSGVVWARVPAAYEPRPAWAAPVDGAAVIRLVPRTAPASEPVTIAVASDTHISVAQPFAHDLAAIAREAVSEQPALFAIVGDIAQGAVPEQYALVDDQLAGLGVPVVRAPGNHDWYDGGAAWEMRYGPDDFSFDVGTVHFIVWNMARSDSEVWAFVSADLARVQPGTMTIVGLTHAPPSPTLAAALRDLGMTTLLTGHLHGNRVVEHDGLREFSTEPLLMGGIDGTPAGYRIVTFGAGSATSEDRTIGDDVHAEPASGSGWCSPVESTWTADAGGHAITAAPVIAGDTVYVTVTDLGTGDGGGVVALNLSSGRVRWRSPMRVPVRGAPAVIGDTVYVARTDGHLLALDRDTGLVRWTTDVSAGIAPQAGAIFAGPIADDGDLLVGNQRRFAAIDGDTGRERWVVDPIPDAPAWVDFAVLAPVAVGGGLVVGTFAREQSGIEAFDRATGALVWRVDERSVDTLAVGIAAAPIIDPRAHAVYIATSSDEVAALDLDTGAVRWHTKLDPRGFDWGAAILGTPALAHGILVVPTLYDDTVALDAASGAVLWRHAAPAPSPLRVTHYRGADEAGFASSPVIAGDVVYVASTDGTLAALDLASGDELWTVHTGAPITAGLAYDAASHSLVLADYDGTVRAYDAVADRDAARCAAQEPPSVARRGGCCDGSGSANLLPSAFLLIALGRRARSRSARRAPRPT
jgi:outer membrane protein assembly factor BamB